MQDLFDGKVNLHRYDRSPFSPYSCEYVAFDNFGSYTLSRMLFEGRDVLLFIVKTKVSVQSAPNGTFAQFMCSSSPLMFSVGGTSYISESKPVQTAESVQSRTCFAGFDSCSNLKLIPGDCLQATENGVTNGAEAYPFLVIHGKRLSIIDESKRSRDRLLLVQLKTGETAFLYIKSVDLVRAAGYAFQLGCKHAAVVGNERRIDIYGKSFIQDRQGGCRAVFAIN